MLFVINGNFYGLHYSRILFWGVDESLHNIPEMSKQEEMQARLYKAVKREAPYKDLALLLDANKHM